MDELKDTIYKLINVYPDNEICVVNITKILSNETKLNKLIETITKANDLKEIKKLRLHRFKNSVEGFLKIFIKNEFKIEQCFKYIIENQFRIRCKIWILYKRDLTKINGSDISDETNEEMEDSVDLDNIKNLESQIKELQKKFNNIEDNILNPVWEERVINKISLKFNERLGFLISSIDSLSQSIQFDKDNENKLNDSSIFI